jgi:hypothetical protein
MKEKNIWIIFLISWRLFVQEVGSLSYKYQIIRQTHNEGECDYADVDVHNTCRLYYEGLGFMYTTNVAVIS